MIAERKWRMTFRLYYWLLDAVPKLTVRTKAFVISVLYGIRVKKCGRLVKFRGAEYMSIGQGFSLGDNCWLEAVRQYEGNKYSPDLRIGDNVALSDSVHISCAAKIAIGNEVLIGSRVYIGDHSHGNVRDFAKSAHLPPAKRPLEELGAISIGDSVWIGDGVVILAGSEIANNSVIGANSVVRVKSDRAALICGSPARIIRFLN